MNKKNFTETIEIVNYELHKQQPIFQPKRMLLQVPGAVIKKNSRVPYITGGEFVSFPIAIRRSGFLTATNLRLCSDCFTFFTVGISEKV